MVQIQEETKTNNGADQKLINGNKSENEPMVVERYDLLFSKRFLVLVLSFIGYFLGVAIKVSINIVIVDMTTKKTIVVGNETIQKAADFDWDSKTIGLVQGCFSYGFFFAVFGGYLTVKFGGSVTYGVTTALESVLTILNPLCMRWGLYVFIVCRIIMGILDGLAYASTAEIYSRWIPYKERSMFMAIVFCGVYIAVAVSYPIFGYVAYYWGWQMVFYITGSSSLVWSIVWLCLIKNEPSKDKHISRKELLYILSEAESTPRKEIVHPYKQIITSVPVWALGIGKLTYSWGFFIIIACLPLYVKDVLHAEVHEVGVISSIPNFACIFVTPLIGALMDYLQNNTRLKPNQIHKIMMTFGYITSSILFVIAACSTNFVVSMTCFVLIKLFLSFNFLILQLVCLYLAPRHSSVLLGISAFWYVISQIAMPSAVGFIVVNHSLQEWNICFFLTAGILMFGAIVYMIFGSSELQPWAESSVDDANNDSIEKDKTTEA